MRVIVKGHLVPALFKCPLRKIAFGSARSRQAFPSLHSEANVRFELDLVWPILAPGGAVVVDDIDVNRGFESFRRAFPGHQSFVCESEPIRPDHRRFNGKGLFGIILKKEAATAAP